MRARRPWQFSLEFMLGESLDGKELLIVGPGRIGRETARLAEAFGAHPTFAGRREPLVERLPHADVVSLHTPLTDETRHLIGAAELAAMKSTAVLVNTSRGPVVDEAALLAALQEGDNRRRCARRLRARAGGDGGAPRRSRTSSSRRTSGRRHPRHSGGDGDALRRGAAGRPARGPHPGERGRWLPVSAYGLQAMWGALEPRARAAAAAGRRGRLERYGWRGRAGHRRLHGASTRRSARCSRMRAPR